MIRSLYERGRHWPLVICDHCDERIADYHEGHALWDGLAETSPVYHAHQGQCYELMQQRIQESGGHAYWDSLDRHLSRLAYNIGMKSPKDFSIAQAKVRREERFAL